MSSALGNLFGMNYYGHGLEKWYLGYKDFKEAMKY
jgi:hypothetical protein